MAVSRALSRSKNPPPGRPIVEARSNRNPSTPISSAQYRSESVTRRTTCGDPASSVLPQPVMSTVLPPPACR